VRSFDPDIARAEREGVAAFDAAPPEGLQEELRHRCIAVVTIEYVNVLGPESGTLVHFLTARSVQSGIVSRAKFVQCQSGRRHRSTNHHGSSSHHADVPAGKPVIRGTRLSVEFVIGLMADGWREADILENFQVLRTRTSSRVSPMLAIH
jgi:hypothetical protein